MLTYKAAYSFACSPCTARDSKIPRHFVVTNGSLRSARSDIIAAMECQREFAGHYGVKC